ncbi:MAG: hypothetical protein ACOX41_09265 [Anaerovoracaceae bacterium]|jgi:hypothetical protein
MERIKQWHLQWHLEQPGPTPLTAALNANGLLEIHGAGSGRNLQAIGRNSEADAIQKLTDPRAVAVIN